MKGSFSLKIFGALNFFLGPPDMEVDFKPLKKSQRIFAFFPDVLVLEFPF